VEESVSNRTDFRVGFEYVYACTPSIKVPHLVAPLYLICAKMVSTLLTQSVDSQSHTFHFVRHATRPHKETSDVFSPKFRANTLLRIRFSADVIINTSSNIRLYTAFAMYFTGIAP